METTLRPLTLGEILDRTAQLYRSNFALFAGIFSFYAGVSLVLGLVQLAFAELTKGRPWATWAVVGIGGLKAIVVILLLGASIAAISRTVASLHLGEPVTIRGAYASTLPKLGRYLWLMTLAVLWAWGPLVAVYAGFLVAVATLATGRPHGAVSGGTAHAAAQNPTAFLAISGVFFLLLIPTVVYTVWMNLRYALAVPAAVVENIKARQSIKRSIQLSKGARGRIFALLLLVFVIKIGLVLVTQSFVFVVAFKQHGQISTGINALSQVIQFFTNTFLGPIGATGLTLFYFDQRVRNEGYDIEWMMQAAGMALAAEAIPVETAPASAEELPTLQMLAAAPPPVETLAGEAPGNAHE